MDQALRRLPLERATITAIASRQHVSIARIDRPAQRIRDVDVKLGAVGNDVRGSRDQEGFTTYNHPGERNGGLHWPRSNAHQQQKSCDYREQKAFLHEMAILRWQILMG